MGNLPKIGQPETIPVVLPAPGYLMDHHFQGKPVLPAVEAMAALARIAKETYPHLRVDHLTDAGFEKFLFIEDGSDQIEAIAKFEPQENGSLQATLLTRTKAPKAAFTRTKTHIRLTIVPSGPQPNHWPMDRSASLEGICAAIPPEKIYSDLVPFGPTFRNIKMPLYISPDGAMAQIKTPGRQYHPSKTQAPLGSGYALDAAFHAACVWSQHYKGIVAFPVGVERRNIIAPTRPDTTYVGRILPKSISETLMIFDILLLDENGRLCETAEGVHMRDVSSGRLQPPDWIQTKDTAHALDNLQEACGKMALVELNTVAPFAHQALTPMEKERHQKMGDRRRISFLAARMALKNLYRRDYKDNDMIPAHQIETVCKDSSLPCVGPIDASEEKYCSVSHDRRFALAVSHNRPIGVDVEVISPKALKADRIFMSLSEQSLVKQSSMDSTAAAVRIWSVKEAATKAMGIALAEAWQRVEVTHIGDVESTLSVDGTTRKAQHAVVDEHLFTILILR